MSDLEAAYMDRGFRLAECEAARALAVETLLAERALQDRWRSEASSRTRKAARAPALSAGVSGQ
ncbi:MAG TPA: hypothetical protein VM471_07640 [Phenylobacterium sp.]|nr:hypothetical protein [Phenylobacterium sp.]